MRTTKRRLEFLVEQINKELNRPMTSWTRSKDGKLTGNLGNFHLSSNAPGDGVTRYELHEMANEQGGIHLIVNRCFLGAGSFDDFLIGFLEGIRLGKEAKLAPFQSRLAAERKRHPNRA